MTINLSYRLSNKKAWALPISARFTIDELAGYVVVPAATYWKLQKELEEPI